MWSVKGIDMKKYVFVILMVLLVSSICLFGIGCKADEEIVVVATPKPETQTIYIRQQTEKPEHYFTVIGNGEIYADPDFATLIMKASATGETAEEASALCQEESQSLIKTARSKGVFTKDTTQRGVELEPRFDEDGQTVLGYQATDVVTFIIRKVENTESIVAALMDAGSFELVGTTYSITEASEAYKNALSAAIEDAKQKAEVLAGTSGVKLGKVIGMTESPSNEESLIGVAFESSAIAVSAQVSVQFEID